MPLQRRLPKVGFWNPFSKDVVVVNIRDLERFESGKTITPETLREAGLVKGPRTALVKILGQGELTKSLTVSPHAFSASAQEKIKANGGNVQFLEVAKPERS